MNVLTLKIPEELDAALLAASRARGLSKSAVVREALEESLGRHAEGAATAERWLAHWRGRLTLSRATQTNRQTDARLAHLLAKHLR
jgi:predicted transcriptional regulator